MSGSATASVAQVVATRAAGYEVVGELGRGATAVVELAVAPDGTRVARKRLALLGPGAEAQTARARLRREAEVLARLHHPGIVTLLAVDDDGDDLVLVMPALAGNLADLVARRGPLPPTDVVRAATRLLGALAAAHRAGVVHRDVKPANVLVDHRGDVALADFGVAACAGLTAGLTAAGSVIGTPAWLAPEQARGEQAGPAADVYSLGATLCFALTGASPWGHEVPAVAVARAAAARPVVLPAAIPASLAPALSAMLDPDPARRPSAAALLAAGPFAGPATPGGPNGGGADGGGTAVLPARPPLPATPGRSRRRRRLDPLLAAGAALVGVAVAATVLLPGGNHRAQPRAATPPTTTCAALPYRPCGQPAAPHTDGTGCLPGYYDLDGAAADGCEAASDWRPGTALVTGAWVRADVVPPTAVDTFTTRVDGHLTSICGGTLALTITAPAGAADRLVVTDAAGRTVASTTSADGAAATAAVHKPGCLGSHSETLTLTVTEVAGASGADFTLSRSGGW